MDGKDRMVFIYNHQVFVLRSTLLKVNREKNEYYPPVHRMLTECKTHYHCHIVTEHWSLHRFCSITVPENSQKNLGFQMMAEECNAAKRYRATACQQSLNLSSEKNGHQCSKAAFIYLSYHYNECGTQRKGWKFRFGRQQRRQSYKIWTLERTCSFFGYAAAVLVFLYVKQLLVNLAGDVELNPGPRSGSHGVNEGRVQDRVSDRTVRFTENLPQPENLGPGIAESGPETSAKYGLDAKLCSSAVVDSDYCNSSEGYPSTEYSQCHSLSSTSSTDSYVQTNTGEFSIFVMGVAKCDEDLKQMKKKITSPLDEAGLPYFFLQKDRFVAISQKKCISKAMKKHPVTVLPLTRDFNTDFPDKFFHELFLEGGINAKDCCIICIKMSDGVSMPSMFESLGCLDFTSTGELLKNELDSFIRQAKRGIEKRKRISKFKESPAVIESSPSIDPRPLLPAQTADEQMQFVSIKYGMTNTPCGPQISLKYIKDAEQQFSREFFDKMPTRNLCDNLRDIKCNLSKFKLATRYLKEILIPRLRRDRDYPQLAFIASCTRVLGDVQVFALEAIQWSMILDIPPFEDLTEVENLLGGSIMICETSCLRLRVYIMVLQKLFIACATEDRTDDSVALSIVKVASYFASKKLPSSASLTLDQFILDYSKKILQKAKDRLPTLKDSITGSKSDGQSQLPSHRFTNDLQNFTSVMHDIDDVTKETTDVLVDDIASRIRKFFWFEQFLVLDYIAHKVNTQEEFQGKLNLLRIFERIVCQVSRENSRKFLVHVTQLFVALTENSTDDDFLTEVLEGSEPKKLMGLGGLLSFIIRKRKDSEIQYMTSAIKQSTTLFHPSKDVRKFFTEKLLAKNPKPGESSDISIKEVEKVNQHSIMRAFGRFGLGMCAQKKGKGPDTYIHNPKFHAFDAEFDKTPVRVYVMSQENVKEFVGDHESESREARNVKRQLELALKVTHHKNIIDVLAYQISPSPVFIISEGWKETLSDHLIKRAKEHDLLTVINLVKLFILPMLEAVQFCHSRNIILRDIVPSNFFVSESPEKGVVVKYYNFRLAKRIQDERTQEIKGHPEDPIPLRHSAPESLLSSLFSTMSDSWMTSCFAYVVLTHGCQPYTELYNMPINFLIQRVIKGYRLQQPACIPDDLYTILIAGIIQRPSCRQTVSDFQQYLADLLEEYNSKGEQKLDLLPQNPPIRDKNQPKLPERERPIDFEELLDDDSKLYPQGAACDIFPCMESEVLAPDDPTQSIENNGVLEEFLIVERNADDDEAITRLDHSNITNVIRVEHINGQRIQKSEGYIDSNLLQQCKDGHCSEEDLLDYLGDVADAMDYAHQEGWVHNCLKAVFIFIRQGRAKVGRWGRAVRPEERLYFAPHQNVHEGQMQEDILRWASPEVVINKPAIFSQKGDVFMFAQLIWETFNALLLEPSMPEGAFVPYPNKDKSKIEDSLKRREHQIQPPNCPDWLFWLMKKMWLCERSMRPSFDVIAECIKKRSRSPYEENIQLKRERHKSMCKGSRRPFSLVDVEENLEGDDKVMNYYEKGTIKDQLDHNYMYNDFRGRSKTVHAAYHGKRYHRPRNEMAAGKNHIDDDLYENPGIKKLRTFSLSLFKPIKKVVKSDQETQRPSPSGDYFSSATLAKANKGHEMMAQRRKSGKFEDKYKTEVSYIQEEITDRKGDVSISLFKHNVLYKSADSIENMEEVSHKSDQGSWLSKSGNETKELRDTHDSRTNHYKTDSGQNIDNKYSLRPQRPEEETYECCDDSTSRYSKTNTPNRMNMRPPGAIPKRKSTDKTSLPNLPCSNMTINESTHLNHQHLATNRTVTINLRKVNPIDEESCDWGDDNVYDTIPPLNTDEEYEPVEATSPKHVKRLHTERESQNEKLPSNRSQSVTRDSNQTRVIRSEHPRRMNSLNIIDHDDAKTDDQTLKHIRGENMKKDVCPDSLHDNVKADNTSYTAGKAHAQNNDDTYCENMYEEIDEQNSKGKDTIGQKYSIHSDISKTELQKPNLKENGQRLITDPSNSPIQATESCSFPRDSQENSSLKIDCSDSYQTLDKAMMSISDYSTLEKSEQKSAVVSTVSQHDFPNQDHSNTESVSALSDVCDDSFCNNDQSLTDCDEDGYMTPITSALTPAIQCHEVNTPNSNKSDTDCFESDFENPGESDESLKVLYPKSDLAHNPLPVVEKSEANADGYMEISESESQDCYVINNSSTSHASDKCDDSIKTERGKPSGIIRLNDMRNQNDNPKEASLPRGSHRLEEVLLPFNETVIKRKTDIHRTAVPVERRLNHLSNKCSSLTDLTNRGLKRKGRFFSSTFDLNESVSSKQDVKVKDKRGKWKWFPFKFRRDKH
ncbi:uncharacterized protein [Ptychodera flava]|uniref:uncharacterized protein isoform X2 n=1 Tax=Ptychodera flava TaxID=63121 RepID=UPI00396A8D6A